MEKYATCDFMGLCVHVTNNNTLSLYLYFFALCHHKFHKPFLFAAENIADQLRECASQVPFPNTSEAPLRVSSFQKLNNELTL